MNVTSWDHLIGLYKLCDSWFLDVPTHKKGPLWRLNKGNVILTPSFYSKLGSLSGLIHPGRSISTIDGSNIISIMNGWTIEIYSAEMKLSRPLSKLTIQMESTHILSNGHQAPRISSFSFFYNPWIPSTQMHSSSSFFPLVVMWNYKFTLFVCKWKIYEG